MGTSDPNVGSAGSAAVADSESVRMSSRVAPDSSPSPLDFDSATEIEKLLGSGMSMDSLNFAMDITDDETDENGGSTNGKKRRKQRRSRTRLSLSQVYCLEKNFKADSRLDILRKHQLAKDLGLKPRQVTVWFQNRRARNKDKGEEMVQKKKDYDKMAEKYAVIKTEYDKVVDHNKKLRVQMKRMKEEMSIMKDSLLNYGKLMRAGLIANPHQMGLFSQTTNQIAQTHQPQVVQTQPQQPQFVPQQTRPDLLKNRNSSVLIDFGNVSNGGVIAPGLGQVQQPVNSPASVTSAFDSNSGLAAAQQAVVTQVLELAPPGEYNNTNQDLSNNKLIADLLDLGDQNCFGSFKDDAAPSNNSKSFELGVSPMDDEAFWEFEL